MPATIEELRYQFSAEFDNLDRAFAKIERVIAKADAKMGGAFKKGERAVDKQTVAVKKLNKSMEGINKTVIKATLLYTAWRAAVGSAQISTEYKNMAAQIRLVSKGSEDAVKTQDKLFKLAQKTRQSYQATVSTFTRISRSVAHLNKTEKQRLNITEAINKSLLIGGGNMQESSSAAIQLAQGLASGRLAGDELRSVLENAPRLAQTIADGLDVTIGKLREMGSQGILTGEQVFDAILSQKKKLDAEFETIPVTIVASIAMMSNSITQSIGKMDEMTGTSEKVAAVFVGLSEIIDLLPDHLQEVEVVVNTVATAVAVALVPALWSAVAAAAAFAATPLGLAVIGISGVVAALTILDQKMGESSTSTENLEKATDLLAQAHGFADESARLNADGQAAAGEAARVAGVKAANAAAKWAILARVQAEDNAIGQNRFIQKRLREDRFYRPNTDDPTGPMVLNQNMKGQYDALIKGGKIAEADAKRARELQDKTVDFLAELLMDGSKIPKAEVIVTPKIDHGSVKKQVAKILKEIQSPFEKMQKEGQKIKKLLDIGALTQEQHDKKQKILVDTYHQEVQSLKVKTDAYKLDQEAQSLIDSNLTKQQTLSKAIERINLLKEKGLITEQQAAQFIENARKNTAVSSAGAGASNDNLAYQNIARFGTVDEKLALAAKKYADELRKLNDLRAKGIISENQHASAVAASKKAYESTVEGIKAFNTGIQSSIDQVKSDAKSFFSDFYNNGKMSFESLGKAFDNLMNKIISRLMDSVLDGLFSPSSSGGGGIGDFIGSLISGAVGGSSQISGARAKGGPTQGGKTYLVGENGPELFTDNSSGFIHPAHKLHQHQAQQQSSGLGGNVIINNYGNDRVTSKKSGNDTVVDIDPIEMLENGLVKRIHDGDSNLPQAFASSF